MCELFGVTANRRVKINELLKRFFEHSCDHRNGWGLAFLDDNSVSIEKEPIRASDSLYLKNRLTGRIETARCMAHIRKATIGDVNFSNTHPFSKRDESGRIWVLVHNGTIFESPVLSAYQYKQEGTTDSERILLYIVDQVNKHYIREQNSFDANDRIRGSLESIRRAVRVLDDETKAIAASDLKADMESIIHEFVMDRTYRVDHDFSRLPDGGKIPGEHAVFLTGALQEFLTNGVKHGHATEYVVIMIGDSAHIRLEVSDNGTGDFNADNRDNRIRNGFGIKKIISYAEKNGGKTEFSNGHGFRSIVELPIYITS